MNFGEWEASDALAFVERTESHLGQLIDAINAGDGDRALEHLAEAVQWNRRTGKALGGAATPPAEQTGVASEPPRLAGQYIRYIGGPCNGWTAVIPESVKRIWSARALGKTRRPMLLESSSADLPAVPLGTEMVGFYEIDVTEEVARWTPVKRNPDDVPLVS